MKIHADDLYKKFQKGLSKDEIILDIREDDEWQEGHIPGARHIPIDDLTAPNNKHLDELKKFKSVYVHCKGGGRAGRATSALSAMGLTNIVCVSDSGMTHWIEKKYPVAMGK